MSEVFGIHRILMGRPQDILNLLRYIRILIMRLFFIFWIFWLAPALILANPQNLEKKAKKFYQAFEKGNVSLLNDKWERKILLELSPSQWYLLRNALYGKHGYRFKSRKLKKFFSRIKWYKPLKTNVDSLLDTTDLSNIELIKTLEKERELYGIWQDSPIMGSAWGKTYLFFPKGKFVFHHSQMDCASTELSFAGNWQLEGEKLILEIKEKTILEGGLLVPATGSCATPMEIQGGKNKCLLLEEPEKQSLKIIWVKMDATAMKKAFVLENKKYWQFSDNPSMYENQ